MTYRLVAADLDGTLRPEGKNCTTRVRAAIAAAQSHDVRVVMATGRMFRTAEWFARDLGLKDSIICDQGATIRDLDNGQLVFQKHMPAELAERVIREAPRQFTLLACVDEEFYAERITPEAIAFVSPRHVQHLHKVADLTRLNGSPPQKLVFIGDEYSTGALFGDLSARFGNELQVVQSYPLYVELTHIEVSKGKAVAWLAERWGIRRDEVIAIGDQDNDRSMIEWAGLGVAMGNAVASAKSIAQYVAPTVDEDGVAAVLERFVLSDSAQ